LTRKVLILAGDTDGNLGDLAIVTATCDHIRRVDPHSSISIVTSSGARDRGRLDIAPIARGWRGIAALFNSARHADLVICGGGGLFQDDDSLLKMPYWAVRLLFLRLLSGPIEGLSIGAGPLDHVVSRYFARVALRQLSGVSVRDSLAQSVLAPLTRKNIEVVPDPAFLLAAASESQARSALENSGAPTDGTPLVGVAVRRWFHKNSSLIPYKYASKLGLQKNRGQREMSAFVRLAAEALDEVAEQTNAHVVFMPTYNVGHEADIEVCEAVARKMRSRNCSFLLLDNPQLYKAVTGLLDAMLCGRMHPAILAAGQGTPIVGLAYNQKFFGTFSMLEQSDRCMSISDFVDNGSSGQLSQMLLAALAEPEKYRPETTAIERRTKRYIDKLIIEPSKG